MTPKTRYKFQSKLRPKRSKRYKLARFKMAWKARLKANSGAIGAEAEEEGAGIATM